jgi:hypothetical protein
VKDGFIFFGNDWPETIHPAHVVHAVHRGDYRADLPTPASDEFEHSARARRCVVI